MPRVVKDAQLTTVSVRHQLPEGVHWRRLAENAHLGYRKRKRGVSTWAWRYYVGNGKYWQGDLPSTDDTLKANGDDILTFHQAKSRAKKAIIDRQRDEKAKEAKAPRTVADAVASYMKEREKPDARSRFARYVIGDATRNVKADPIASALLTSLDDDDLRAWRERISGKGDTKLAEPTVRRISADLRAALNHALKHFGKSYPGELATCIQRGLEAKAGRFTPERVPDNQVLSTDEVRRIVEAAREVDARDGWQGDLYRLVLVLAATGARFSQVIRLCVADVQTDRNRIMVPVSLKGRGTKKRQSAKVAVSPDDIAALLPVIRGRDPDAPLLERSALRAQGNGRWRWDHDARGPWEAAYQITPLWPKILALAGLDKRKAKITPYALRHSSIVRDLAANLPIQYVALTHDTSVEIIEKHYAAYTDEALDHLAQASTVSLITVPADVIPLRRPRS